MDECADRRDMALFAKSGVSAPPLPISSVVILFWSMVLVPSFVLLAFHQWQESVARPSLTIPLSRWRVLTDQPMCLRKEGGCPVARLEESTWGKSLSRDSDEYWNWIETTRPHEYWLGLTVDSQELERVLDLEANYLLLGYYYSSYQLWIDGENYETRGIFEKDGPIEVVLSRERLSSGQPLRIAIRLFDITHGLRVDFPIKRANSDFFTGARVERYLRWSSFEGQTKHWMFFAIYLVFGLLFFVVWQADSHKREYWVATVFCFISATLNLFYLDGIDRILQIQVWYRIYASLVFGEIATILLLGFALKRASMSTLVKGGIATCALALCLSLFLQNLVVAQHVLSYLQTFGIPFAWIAVAILLFREHYRNDLRRTEKQYLLLFMAFWSMLCALTQTIDGYHASFPFIELNWSRLLNLFPLFHLLSYFGRSFLVQSEIVSRSPLSQFHQRTILPKELWGYLLSIDLKRSELIYREGAKHEQGGTWVSIIISHLWSLAATKKATVLQSEGDSLALFFPDESKVQLQDILHLLCEMDEVVERIFSQMRESSIELSLESPLRFRAALVEGRVKPIWREVDQRRYPAWIEAGSENVFVIASRLHQFEKDCLEVQNASTLVVLENLRNRLAEVDGLSSSCWVVDRQEFRSKHGEAYVASLLSISGLRESVRGERHLLLTS